MLILPWGETFIFKEIFLSSNKWKETVKIKIKTVSRQVVFILSLYILFKSIKKVNLQGSYELLFGPKIKLNARQKKNGNIGSLPYALFRKTCYRGEDLASTSILGEFWCSQLRRTWKKHIRSETSHLSVQRFDWIYFENDSFSDYSWLIVGTFQWESESVPTRCCSSWADSRPTPETRKTWNNKMNPSSKWSWNKWRWKAMLSIEIDLFIGFIFVTNIQKLFTNRSLMVMWFMEN